MAIITQKTTGSPQGVCEECGKARINDTCGYCAIVSSPQKMEAVGKLVDAAQRRAAEMKAAGTWQAAIEEWTEEFGLIPTFEELSKRYPQYSADPDAAWQALEDENNESLARQMPGYGYARG